MSHHGDMRPEDYDDIDESEIQVHEGNPIDIIVSIRLAPDEVRLLHDLEAREGTDAIGVLRAPLHEYAARRSQAASN